jgi:hypothetical protein
VQLKVNIDSRTSLQDVVRYCGWRIDGSVKWQLVQQTFETVLKLFVFDCVNERVNTAIAEHHDDTEVVEPSVEIHADANEVKQHEHFVARPADDKNTAYGDQGFDDVTFNMFEGWTNLTFGRNLCTNDNSVNQQCEHVLRL